MEMSYFYCVLPASGLDHSVHDGRQAADLAGLPVQIVHYGSFFAQHEMCFHLAFSLDRNRAPEFRLVTAVHQDLKIRLLISATRVNCVFTCVLLQNGSRRIMIINIWNLIANEINMTLETNEQ